MDNKQRINENTAKIEALTKRLEEITISGGGGSSDIGSGDYYLKVIDYDGTILAEKRLNAGDTYTLPNAPSHNGLVFQEWSCSQDIVDGVITIADNNVMVGATYTTASGLSEFDITLTKVTGLDVTLNMNGTKNWGDGTSDDLTTHTYTEYGDYTITCNGTTMTTGYGNVLIKQGGCCKNIRLGDGVTQFSDYALQYCTMLTSISIPKSVTRIGHYVFQYCYSLAGVVIPQGVTFVGAVAFGSCYSLNSIVIPQGVTSSSNNVFEKCYLLENIAIPQSITDMGDYVFSYCHSLKNIIIPQATEISDNAFQYCYSLVSIVIPQGVTSVGRYAFQNCPLKGISFPNGVTSIGGYSFSACYSIVKYDFTQLITIPTLSNTNAFSMSKISKIYVPDNLYDEWIVATNWSTYADYIYKASEMEA